MSVMVIDIKIKTQTNKTMNAIVIDIQKLESILFDSKVYLAECPEISEYDYHLASYEASPESWDSVFCLYGLNEWSFDTLSTEEREKHKNEVIRGLELCASKVASPYCLVVLREGGNAIAPKIAKRFQHPRDAENEFDICDELNSIQNRFVYANEVLEGVFLDYYSGEKLNSISFLPSL